MALLDFFKKKSSGSLAKDRLKLVLISDRANCNPEIMEAIKNDIIKVISKYMEIDCEGLDIQITQTESEGANGTVPVLCANIPVLDMRHSKKN
jgi:cell division topological specificity factor